MHLVDAAIEAGYRFYKDPRDLTDDDLDDGIRDAVRRIILCGEVVTTTSCQGHLHEDGALHHPCLGFVLPQERLGVLFSALIRASETACGHQLPPEFKVYSYRTFNNWVELYIGWDCFGSYAEWLLPRIPDLFNHLAANLCS